MNNTAEGRDFSYKANELRNSQFVFRTQTQFQTRVHVEHLDLCLISLKTVIQGLFITNIFCAGLSC